jgi:hypothetical protein
MAVSRKISGDKFSVSVQLRTLTGKRGKGKPI